MANVAITGLPVVGTMANTSVLPVVVSGTTSQISGANLRTFIGAGNAAGSNTQIQFNDSNAFAGSANLTFNKTTNTLSVTNVVSNSISANIVSANGNVVISSNSNQWTFDSTGNLTIPSSSGGLIKTAANGAIGIVAIDNGTDNPAQLMSWKVNQVNPNTIISAYTNSATIMANVNGTIKTWSFDNTGNLTLPSDGRLIVSGGIMGGGASPAPYLSGFSSISTTGATGNITASGNVNGVGGTFSGNVTAQNFIGNISITGNVIGTSANVDLVAGSYEWSFDNTGNLTLPGNTFAVNYANNTQIDIVTKFEGSWTAPVGNSTQSFTVDANETYQMWVSCNIPNGIIAWNAIATITNTNVPVVGTQYAWVYDAAGTPIDFTSIPNQFVGTSNTIVRSNASPGITTNRFDFGINNSSGSPQTVRYGWIRIS
jgi:hypothetical protein